MNPAETIRATLLEKFRATMRERVERVGRAVLDIGTPAWTEHVQTTAMHELHTMKGEARLMRFTDVSTLAHLGEELLLATHGKERHVRELTLRILDMALVIAQGDAVADDHIVQLLEQGRALVDNAEAPRPTTTSAAPAPQQATPSVRIDVRKLDDLTEISANLIVTQASVEYALEDLVNELKKVDDEGTAAAILEALKQIRDDVRENGRRVHSLEAQVRDLRLLPLASLFDVYPRAIYDLAHEQHKECRVEVAGNDVEIDKHVFEALGEPLLHLVRNAIDHGLETPEERTKAGKEPTATIVLSAEQRGGAVEIEVRDDGRGIDPSMLRDTLIRTNALTASEAAKRSDDQILSYLFHPGFTTRTTVTDVSGRGMGLDIVKQRIEAFGGSVQVTSEPGAGTSFRMRVPISVVLVKALVLEAAGSLCAIPADAAGNVHQLDTDKVRIINDQTHLEVDGANLPLFELAHLLSQEPPRFPRFDADQVVVVQAPTGRIAVLVDRFRGEHKLVHRAMDPFCEGLRMYAGSATLDSGELAILLNVPELLSAGDPQHKALRIDRQPSVLVVEDSDLARTLVVQTLRIAGFAVEEAAHGGKALERLKEWRPDVIVSDIDMPEVDGWSLLREVRRERTLKDVPVIVFSSRAAPQDRERAKALGADAYLVKTQTLESMLVATVARVMSEGNRL